MAVEIKDGILRINGKEVFLFGGEVQYFRIRDKSFKTATTYKLWSQTLDMIKDAGMNLVTTYIPWDYHEREKDRFDFDGARNLELFLQMCYERGLYVQAKPGPYITAEWPLGPRTFGAVPLWLKEEYPQALVITSEGKPLSFDPFGSKWGRQCTYLHALFLERVNKWYQAVAPILLKFIHEKPCIWSVQIDNETNLFWNDHYVVDYSEVALSHYRKFLSEKYKEIKFLNEAYGTKYDSFDEVEPPRARPKYGLLSSPSKNALHIDWYEAGWDYVLKYLITLRQMIEKTGISEPDVLFTTNDTPALTPRLNRLILFWRGNLKTQVGLMTLDSYPRSDPLSRQLDDIPYQTDYATTLMNFYTHTYPLKKGEWVMGAEMQGGMFGYPGLQIKVHPEATARQLVRAIGSGIKSYAVFVLRQGYNLNNSLYRFQAPIDEKGIKTKRFEVLEKAGKKLTAKWGELLNRAYPIKAPAVVLTNRDYQIPLPGAKLNTIDLWHTSYGGLFGWLKRSGFPPDVADIKDLSLNELVKWKIAFYLDPGLMGREDVQKLYNYMQNGGTLVLIGYHSSCDLTGETSSEHHQFSDLFPQRLALIYRRGARLTFLIDGTRYYFRSHGNVFLWEKTDEESEVFVRIPSGGWGGATKKVGRGTLIYLTSDFPRVFNTSKLYKLKEEDLLARIKLAEMIFRMAGEKKVIDWSPPKTECWLRKTNDVIFAFCVNDGKETEMALRFLQPNKIGIKQQKNYTIETLFSETKKEICGGEIIEKGIKIALPKWGSEILAIS